MRKSQFRSAWTSKVLVGAVLAGAFSGQAAAQQPPLLPIPAPGQVMPVASSPATGMEQTAQPVTPVMPKKLGPTYPDAGIAPVADGVDPAAGITLKGSAGTISALTEMSDKRLNSMMGNAGDSIPKDNAALQESLLEEGRAIQLLKKRAERAQLAVNLWGILHENEFAKEARQDEAEAREREAIAEAARMAAQMEAEGNSVSSSQSTSSALMSPGMMPVVAEVNGGTALLLVPGQGQVMVRGGTRLASGLRVTSVDISGVGVVDKDGNDSLLGFGTTAGSAGQ